MRFFKLTIYFIILLASLVFVKHASAVTEFISVVDPGNGTDTDYTSLNVWETGVETNLTAATTQVFLGTRVTAPADNATAYLCTSGNSYRGESATVVHATATQILVDAITGAVAEAATDYWYSNSSCSGGTKYFTLSNGGDSAIAVAKCRTSTGAADTTAVGIDSWTTSATNYIKIWTDTNENYRHQGVWDEGKYNLSVAISGSGSAFDIAEEYTRIEGLQMYTRETVADEDYPYTLSISINNASSDIRISQNILKADYSLLTGGGYGLGIYGGGWANQQHNTKIWNNILYDYASPGGTASKAIEFLSGTAYIYNNTISQSDLAISEGGGGSGTIVVKNNILYDNSNNYSTAFNSASTYNLTNHQTLSGNAWGASADAGMTTSTVANKLVQTGQNFLTTVKVGMAIKNTTDTTYTYVTAIDSDTQLSIAHDIMTSSENFTIYTNMYGTPAFENAEYRDFRLDSSDTAAKNKGANLYADANIAVTTDIDNNARPNSATLFDIGADENFAKIYRSVGPSATGALGTGTTNNQANHLTVSGLYATFELPVADNIGVGDAIQYDDDNDGDIDANDSIVFIDKRFSNQKYRVKTASGAAPAATTAADLDWSIFRAYVSLAKAESISTNADENDSIDDDLENFDNWSSGQDLVTAQKIWNITAYANGTTADTAAVVINGWTTSADAYIRFYTPMKSDEVGVSQRHSGIYDTNKYKLEVIDNAAFDLLEEYVRFDGLQIKVSLPTATGSGILINTVAASNRIEISNNIIVGVFDGDAVQYGAGVYSNDADARSYIWNNIIYDWLNSSQFSCYGLYLHYGAAHYAYNNTIVGNNIGMRANTVGAGSANIVAKNNLIQGSVTDTYMGFYLAGTDYNATDSTDAIGAGSNNRISQTFSFVDSTNKNYHLLPSDAGAKNFGTDLSNDLYLPFYTDVDSYGIADDTNKTRPYGTTWDIGADEVITPIYRSVAPEADGSLAALANGASNPMTVSGSTATFDSALPDNVGVGDVIQYDTDDNGTVDSLAFITGRIDSTHYTIKKADGTPPTAITSTYFGKTSVGGTESSYGPPFSWRNHPTSMPWTCPGTGEQVLVELSLYGKSAGGTPGRARMAIYDSSGDLVAQGSDYITVDNTSASWRGHGTGLTNTLTPSAPKLTGGQNYTISFSIDTTDVLFRYDSGGTNQWSTADDYTSSGWPSTRPDTWSGSGDWNISLRAGVASDQDWSINRAYTSLSNAEAGTENNNINAGLRNFDAGNRDIKANSEQWNFAMFANGTAPDTTAVDIGGWTTSASNYLKIYTPYLTSEVGTSQRHLGKWDDSKYRMATNNARNLGVTDATTNYIRFEGLQFVVNSMDTSGNRQELMIYNPAVNSEFWISNNIFQGTNSGTNHSNLLAIGDNGNGTYKIWNNLFYNNATSGVYVVGLNGKKHYFYNNTIIGGYVGVYGISGNVLAKNNLSSGSYSGLSLYGTFANGTDYNAMDDNPGDYTVYGGGNIHDRFNQTFSFVDATNKDYHLLGTDAGAKDYGADLSQDPVWQQFLESFIDIDGASRPLSGSGLNWDIGADEVSTVIYRSNGPSATSALAAGTGNHLNISGNTATFDTAPGDTIGVGDALEYDANNSGTINAIAFITARTSSTVYTIKSAVGGAPVPQTAADEVHWNIFRAHASLSNAEAGIENSGLTNTVQNFDDWTVGGAIDADDVGRDIWTNNEQWNLAMFANDTAPDTTAATIDGWTTAANNYLKVYTPTATTEVGTSQRHSGKWDTSKYQLVTPSTSILILIADVHIDGLQTQGSSDPYEYSIILEVTSPNYISLSNNLIRNTSGIMNTFGQSPGMKIWNNIVYGGRVGYFIYDSMVKSYFYNNTAYGNSDWGFFNNGGAEFIYKNNLAYDNADNYVFDGYNAASTNNLSGPGTDPQMPTANVRDGVTVSFVNTGTSDFHLAFPDTGAKGYGVNLMNDANLAFQNDIDGQERVGNWSIGADEPIEAVLQSPVLEEQSITSGLVLYQSFDGANISGATALDSSGAGNNGSISGAVPATGERGQALSFNGTDDYVDLSSEIIGTGTVTVCAWINPNPVAVDTYSIIDSRDFNFAVYVNNNPIEALRVSSDNGSTTVYSTQHSIILGAWQHVCVKRLSSGMATFYINGAEDNVDQDSGTPSTAYSSSENIGADHAVSSPFSGSIDEVRVYNRALSVDEIGNLYRLGGVGINMSLTNKNTNGLVGMWSFDGANISGATALDSSGNANHGTISGATPAMGKKGQALNFDGSSDYINVANESNFDFDRTNPFSVSAWVKYNAGSGRGYIYSKTQNSGNFPGIDFGVDILNERLQIYVVGTTGGCGTDCINKATAINTLLSGIWHHVTVTYDGSSQPSGLIFYIDGSASTSTGSENIESSPLNNVTVNLGRESTDQDYLNGSLDEVRVYNRVLSPAEVGDLYRLGTATIKR